GGALVTFCPEPDVVLFPPHANNAAQARIAEITTALVVSTPECPLGEVSRCMLIGRSKVSQTLALGRAAWATADSGIQNHSVIDPPRDHAAVLWHDFRSEQERFEARHRVCIACRATGSVGLTDESAQRVVKNC